MRGFMESVPTQKLEEIYSNAMSDGLEAAANLALQELIRRNIGSIALSNGVYTGEGDELETKERPEDNQWIIRSEN